MKTKKNDEIKDAYPKKVCHMPKKACPKKSEKDADPQKVCHMPTRHVKRKKGKDSPHPRKIKKRDGSCKGVHPPSAKKKPQTCTS